MNSIHGIPRQVRDDLVYVFEWFDLECLEHLKRNRHRLIRGAYTEERGNRCLFGLLSERLPAGQRIETRSGLTRFFTGGSGEGFRDRPEYQPARWLVRLWDGGSIERYGGLDHLPVEWLMTCLDFAIEQRKARHQEEERVRLRALSRLRKRRMIRLIHAGDERGGHLHFARQARVAGQ